MAKNFEMDIRAVLLQPANGDEAPLRPDLAAVRPKPSHFGTFAISFSWVASLFWMGSWAAYLWGYLGAKGLAALEPQQTALFGSRDPAARLFCLWRSGWC